MRKSVVVLVGVALLLAGCAGQSADSRPTAEPTTTPTQHGSPTSTTPYADTPDAENTTSATEPPLPPGTSQAGITNLSALLTAHQSALVGTEYRITARQNMPNRYRQTLDRLQFQVDTDTRRAYANASLQPDELDGHNASVAMYSTDGTQYYRTNAYYSMFYRAHDVEDSFRYLQRSSGGLNRSLNRTLTAGNLQYSETVTDENTSYTRFEIQFDDVDPSNGTVVVREDGLIVGLNVSSHKITRGVTSFRIHNQVDVTIEPVRWTDKARRKEVERLRKPPTQPSTSGSGFCGPEEDICETVGYTLLGWIL